MLSIFSGLSGKLIIGAVILGLISGAYWYVNDSAYNRGAAAVRTEMVELIAKQRQAVEKDSDRVGRLTPDELEAEFRRKCLAAGGSAETCG